MKFWIAKRITTYSDDCQEETNGKWQWKADKGFTFNGTVTINGDLIVTGESDLSGGHKGTNLDGH